MKLHPTDLTALQLANSKVTIATLELDKLLMTLFNALQLPANARVNNETGEITIPAPPMKEDWEVEPKDSFIDELKGAIAEIKQEAKRDTIIDELAAPPTYSDELKGHETAAE